MSIFDKKTGAYTKPSDPLGQWQDSLVGPVMRQLGSDEQSGFDPSKAGAVHPHLSLTTRAIVEDMENLVAGHGVVTPWVRETLIEQGYDPDVVASISGVSKLARIKLHDHLVKQLRKELINRDLTSMVEMLLAGKDSDPCLWLAEANNERISTTCGEVRRALKMTVEEFIALPKEQKLKASARVSHRLRQRKKDDEAWLAEKQERTRLHQSLRSWAAGPLKIERPNGSSLHHLLDYDSHHTEGNFAKVMAQDDCQIIVVEHDWSPAVPASALGEWHLPFKLTCWEFRISGVRVLAFTDCIDEKHPRLWITYGRDERWVSDDYSYVVGHGLLIKQKAYDVDPIEFPRVVKLVHDCIRSACIMMDARIVHHEHVPASKKLNERRVAEQKRPLRDHYVVRLLNNERRAHRAARSNGAGTVGTRNRQRGHWRIGTWVHYDDPDSGQVQYANDGGFIVSKTWRRWHFAGDPNNIIHKQYRV